MEKRNDFITIKVNQERNSVDIRGMRNETLNRYKFEDSEDFCKWILEMARDMRLSRLEFASACNQVTDDVEGWDNI